MKHNSIKSSRISRKQYWLRMLFYFPLFFIILIISKIEEQILPDDGAAAIIMLVIFLFLLASAFLCASTASKRLHDINKSGKWCFLIIIPLFFIILAIVIGFIKPYPYENKWELPKNL